MGENWRLARVGSSLPHGTTFASPMRAAGPIGHVSTVKAYLVILCRVRCRETIVDVPSASGTNQQNFWLYSQLLCCIYISLLPLHTSRSFSLSSSFSLFRHFLFLFVCFFFIIFYPLAKATQNCGMLYYNCLGHDNFEIYSLHTRHIFSFEHLYFICVHRKLIICRIFVVVYT